MPAAIAALALIAIVGAVLMILDSPSTPRRLDRLTHLAPTAERIVVAPDPQGALIFTVDTNGSGDDTRTVGSVLLIVALAGIVLATLSWLWLGPVDWSRRRSHIDDWPNGGHAY